MRKTMSLLAAATLAAGVFAAPAYTGPVKAQEVRARAGVGHFLEKVKAGKEVTVAYLGGSITAMNGWRNLTTDWLRATYPQAKFKEIHAAIGGTGSNLGVFRVAHDALQHNPDLLFVEFATNDGGAQPQAIWRSMEGIVRQTWKKDPSTDIVFTYTITAAMKQDYLAGNCNRAASAMEQLADHYGIPSICFGPRVIDAVKAGTLVMKGSEPHEGKTLFAQDGVHPGLPGHKFYLASIVNGFTQMKDMPPADHAAALRTPFVADNLEAAKMVEIEPSMLTGDWQKLPPTDSKSRSFSKRMGDMWYTGAPGATLRFTFRGSCCQIYDLLGPDGGQVWITVDGKKSAKPAARFDSYCTYHRIATLGVFNGADGVHTVEITVDKDQPSRQPVAFRLKDPATELAAAKFQGTKFWPAKIMLVGDLVK